MAIVIEQEHKETNWIGLITTGIIIIIMFVGGYYLFFTQPELLSDIGVPATVQKLSKIVELPKVSPTEVIGTSNFSQLKDFSTPITLPSMGKSNPFTPF